mmetsp:Transcript_56625/g.123841  ORF Transcript_56625/g.123841 Transcript_56625/m.123841 type:complete len:345 (+) Transcript_56625:1285-2319(+)
MIAVAKRQELLLLIPDFGLRSRLRWCRSASWRCSWSAVRAVPLGRGGASSLCRFRCGHRGGSRVAAFAREWDVQLVCDGVGKATDLDVHRPFLLRGRVKASNDLFLKVQGQAVQIFRSLLIQTPVLHKALQVHGVTLRIPDSARKGVQDWVNANCRSWTKVVDHLLLHEARQALEELPRTLRQRPIFHKSPQFGVTGTLCTFSQGPGHFDGRRDAGGWHRWHIGHMTFGWRPTAACLGLFQFDRLGLGRAHVRLHVAALIRVLRGLQKVPCLVHAFQSRRRCEWLSTRSQQHGAACRWVVTLRPWSLRLHIGRRRLRRRQRHRRALLGNQPPRRQFTGGILAVP